MSRHSPFDEEIWVAEWWNWIITARSRCFRVTVRVSRTLDYSTINLIRDKVHRIVTTHARPRQTDRRTDERTAWQQRDDSYCAVKFCCYLKYIVWFYFLKKCAVRSLWVLQALEFVFSKKVMTSGRNGLGGLGPNMLLSPHRETYTGQESGGELCEIWNFHRFCSQGLQTASASPDTTGAPHKSPWGISVPQIPHGL